MCGKQDTLSFLLRQLPEKQTEFVAVGQVKEGGRFVEQDDRSVLCKGTGYHDALAFSVGHFVHRLFRIAVHAYQVHGVVHLLLVFSLQLTEPVGIGSTSQCDDVSASQQGEMASPLRRNFHTSSFGISVNGL